MVRRLLFFVGSSHLSGEFSEVCSHSPCLVCCQTNTWQRHDGPKRILSEIKSQDFPTSIAANGKEPRSVFWNFITDSKFNHILSFPKLKPAGLNAELTFPTIR